jgi:hypothetical protein
MRFGLALSCLLACCTSAMAQYGVSNQRDAYGNLVRDAGGYSRRGINQGPVNNGAIKNTPPQPLATTTKGAVR